MARLQRLSPGITESTDNISPQGLLLEMKQLLSSLVIKSGYPTRQDGELRQIVSCVQVGRGASPAHARRWPGDRLVKARHRFHFDEDTKAPGSTWLWSRAEWEFTDEDGQVWRLEAQGIREPFYNAGQSYDDRHGLDRGPLLLEGERWDFNQPETLKSLRRSGDDRWHFDIQNRLVELSLNGSRGVGLVNIQGQVWSAGP